MSVHINSLLIAVLRSFCQMVAVRLVYRFAIPRYLYELIWFAFNGSRLNPSMVRCLVPLFRGFNLIRLLWYGRTLGLSPVWSGRDLLTHYSMGLYILTRLLWYGSIFRLISSVVQLELSSHYSMGLASFKNTIFYFLFYLCLLRVLMFMSIPSLKYQGICYNH